MSSEKVKLIYPSIVQIAGQDVVLPEGLTGKTRYFRRDIVAIDITLEVPRAHVRTVDNKEIGHE